MSVHRDHGERPRPGRRAPACSAARARHLEATVERERAHRRRERRLAVLLAVAGAAVLAALAWSGRGSHAMPSGAGGAELPHASLRPPGSGGRGVGIGGALLVLSALLYAARKRLGFLEGLGAVRAWLQLHVFAGAMGLVAIAFHAALRSGDVLATAGAAALALVALTGLVCRCVHGLVPSACGAQLEIEQLQARFVWLRDELEVLLVRADEPRALRRLVDLATSPARRLPLPLAIVAWPFSVARARLALAHAELLPAGSRAEFREAYLRLRLLRMQITSYRALTRSLAAWRVVHAATAAVLVLVAAAHVGLSLHLGRIP